LQVYQALGQDLLKTLVPEIVRPQATQSIVLIPDVWLSALPFEALVSGEKKASRWPQVAYWCRQVKLQYGYSLGVLLSQLELSTPSHGGMLALAPGFDKAERDLAPLRNSKAEIEQIKGIKKKTYFQNQATWQHFAEKAPSFNILHLATHASADSVHNTAGIEFYERRAFLSDIYALPLHADLVCLSACESGLGEWKQGEGVMSLARAFAYAGAKGLVATLWSVNEVSSSILFQSFYQHLHKGETKAQALHSAKLDYLNDVEIPAFQKTPYYWAALTYVGEDSVVQMGNPALKWYVIVGGVLVIRVLLFFFVVVKKRPGFWNLRR
jgi:CHAT domain-containing protein